MSSFAARDPPQSPALATGVCAGAVGGSQAQAGGAHAALCAVRPGHRPARRVAQSRHRIRGGQDRRHGRRPAQRHARKPDRTSHRADRVARRATYPGEGIHRRGDRHQYPVHAGRFVFPRRPQAPRAGIQQGQRPPASGPAVSGRCRHPDSVGGLASRFRGGVGIHGNIERLSVRPAHRRLRTGPAVLAQDPSRILRRARNTRRPAKRRGRWVWPWPRWPGLPCWSRW